jgi:ppGpp synthetase/RelA/SpoT-type nucleotidyltranferase
VIEKLQRETIRLSQVQDIAGCRLLVTNVVAQDRVVATLLKLFPDATVTDRRVDPSHGYRAVHVIVRIDRMPIEIQIRSRLQHLWAEVSEKLSDVVDPGLKYGRGPRQFQELLLGASRTVAQFEKNEADYIKMRLKKTDVRQISGQLKRIKKGLVKFLADISKLSDIIERDE